MAISLSTPSIRRLSNQSSALTKGYSVSVAGVCQADQPRARCSPAHGAAGGCCPVFHPAALRMSCSRSGQMTSGLWGELLTNSATGAAHPSMDLRGRYALGSGCLCLLGCAQLFATGDENPHTNPHMLHTVARCSAMFRGPSATRTMARLSGGRCPTSLGTARRGRQKRGAACLSCRRPRVRIPSLPPAQSPVRAGHPHGARLSRAGVFAPSRAPRRLLPSLGMA